MNRIVRSALSLAMASSLSFVFNGCAPNHAYRDKQPVLHELAPENKLKYSLAFVEFDDVGEMFSKPGDITVEGGKTKDNTELGQTIAEIQRINRGEEGPNPIFVLFIHGWQNNASDSSGNVWGFRADLQSLANELAPHPVMGIYIGWRGAVTTIPVAKEFTFWNRKDAATRIPGAHLTEALRRITMAAKSNPNAKCIVVGHSFGGLVMERTLTQAMVELILENEEDNEKIGAYVARGGADVQKVEQDTKDAETRLNRSLPDLTVLLNEAGPATEAKEFLNFLTNEDLEFSDGVRPHPLFLSLTSTGDAATHIIFPVGQFLGKHGLETRKYEGSDEFSETDQNHYFLHTTANSPKLVNYTITLASRASAECKTTAYQDFRLNKTDEKTTYYICPSQGAKNKTPYWVLQIPTEFVPDHGRIFKPELRALLKAFIDPHFGPEPIRLRRKQRPELKSTGQ